MVKVYHNQMRVELGMGQVVFIQREVERGDWFE
jgi:hypothetical protein